MGMSVSQAKQLNRGDQLRFGSDPRLFEVVGVLDKGVNQVHIILQREDGYETHATENDLDVAEVHLQSEGGEKALRPLSFGVPRAEKTDGSPLAQLFKPEDYEAILTAIRAGRLDDSKQLIVQALSAPPPPNSVKLPTLDDPASWIAAQSQRSTLSTMLGYDPAVQGQDQTVVAPVQLVAPVEVPTVDAPEVGEQTGEEPDDNEDGGEELDPAAEQSEDAVNPPDSLAGKIGDVLSKAAQNRAAKKGKK